MRDDWLLLRRWDGFLSASGTLNDNTRAQYRRALVGFLAETMTSPRDVTEDDIVAWIRARGGTRTAAVLRALHSFYGWASVRDEISPNPVRAIRVPRHRYDRGPALTPDQMSRIMAAARRHRDPRVAPTLELMYATGGRVGSICALTAEDVDLERAWVRFRVAKNDDPYGVPLNDRGLAAVRELLDLADYTAWGSYRRPTLVGVGTKRVEQWVQDVERDVGIRVWPHRLRRQFITEMANDPQVSIFTVARAVNHKDPRVTLSYRDEDDEALRAAFAR